MNEREDFLLELVHIIGIKLKTVARCNSIKCIRYGPFTLEHALLPHSWTVENFVSNVQLCNSINEKDIKSGRRDKAVLATVECEENQLHDGVIGNQSPTVASPQSEENSISHRVGHEHWRKVKDPSTPGQNWVVSLHLFHPCNLEKKYPWYYVSSEENKTQCKVQVFLQFY